MKALKLILLCIVFASISFSCSKDSPEVEKQSLNPKESYKELNINYGPDKDQKLDLYLPANRNTATKTMILVHGGGWSEGDKVDMNTIKDIINQELPDVAVVNINYRLATTNKNPYPMQLDDITEVINYLKENKDFYVMSDDYGFLGISAGAHLSMLWSYAFDTNKNIKMVCSVVGPTNFTDPFYLNPADPNIKGLMDLFGEKATTEFLKEVSPYHQVTVAAPPTILFYGGQDPVVPASQGTAMSERLKQLGVTHEFTLYEHAGHGWLGPELSDTVEKLKIFTKTHLLQ